MRGSIDGLEQLHSLADGLPPAFFGNEFTERFVGAFDAVLAPVFATIDHLPSYLDPRVAPDDFVAWLAGWIGLDTNGRWPPERVRRLVAAAPEIQLWRGTRRAVVAAVRAYAAAEPDVADSGAVRWSPTPGGPVPGEHDPYLAVRVSTDDPSVDEEELTRLLADLCPAHVVVDVEVRRQGDTP